MLALLDVEGHPVKNGLVRTQGSPLPDRFRLQHHIGSEGCRRTPSRRAALLVPHLLRSIRCEVTKDPDAAKEKRDMQVTRSRLSVLALLVLLVSAPGTTLAQETKTFVAYSMKVAHAKVDGFIARPKNLSAEGELKRFVITRIQVATLSIELDDMKRALVLTNKRLQRPLDDNTLRELKQLLTDKSK